MLKIVRSAGYLGGSRGAGDDVLGGAAAASPVLAGGPVDGLLGGGGRVHGRHQALRDAEVLVDHLRAYGRTSVDRSERTETKASNGNVRTCGKFGDDDERTMGTGGIWKTPHRCSESSSDGLERATGAMSRVVLVPGLCIQAVNTESERSELTGPSDAQPLWFRLIFNN